jgi:hypothetical protein
MYGGEESDMSKFWWGILRKRNHLEEPDVDGMVILSSVFGKLDVGPWTGSSRLRL